jgi:uncharacterized repeat protein (TIGR03803 family)
MKPLSSRASRARLLRRTATAALALLLLSVARAAATEKVLYAFTGGSDGGGPSGALAFDASGNIFGTTHFGGIVTCGGFVGGGCGVVFELSPNGNGTWTETPIYAFADGADGGFPNSGVLLDGAGNVYGTASTGGSAACSIGCGVVYQLLKSSTFTEYVLHTFSGPDGQFPNASLFPSPPITQYSTTVYGGKYGNGTVFSMQSTPDDGWSENVVYSFTGKDDGSKPYAGVVQDKSGNLYGTTYPSDSYNNGVVYELRPRPNGTWKERILHAFGSSPDGSNPYAGVIIGSRGTLFGTTINGGKNGGGTVYELSRTAPATWQETILHSFGSGNDGRQPYNGVIEDRAENLYGTTLFGGKHNYGTVYVLTPQPSGMWKERILYNFTGKADGGYPSPGLLRDPAGNLYGATSNGGVHGAGVIFEITP